MQRKGPFAGARRLVLALGCLLVLAVAGRLPAAEGERHLLYVGEPGVRDYVEWGGAGVLVFDIDNGYRWVKRIPTFAQKEGAHPEAVKGICANAKTGRLYLSTPTRLLCLDLVTDKPLWEKTYPGGCDRMSMTPDGKLIYLPTLEGPHWNVVDGMTGEVLTKVQLNSGSHNTIVGLDGSRAYLAGLKSPVLSIADAPAQRVVAN